MRTIDWDWPAQLKTCQNRIAELEQKIASQREKVQRLLDCRMNATTAERLLAIREQSLDRLRSHKYLIETRIADRAVNHYAIHSDHLSLLLIDLPLAPLPE